MIERTIGQHDTSAPLALWRLVADALENERALDIKYRLRSTGLLHGRAPNFKIMKQLALQTQWGGAYSFLICVAPIAVVLAVPLQWLLLLLGAAFSPKRALSVNACRVFATTQGNCAIIDAALDADPGVATLPRYQIHFDSRSMGAEIGLFDSIFVIRSHLRWLIYALTQPSGVRADLLLHGYDAIALLGFASLARKTKHVFVTDDHYQRWAHVLSHAAQDFRIVQHGFLDEELVLPHEGGGVNCLYLRDELFSSSFMRYYEVMERRLFSPPATFVETPFSDVALLLASSFPSIDEEIRLLNAVRASSCAVPIIVKFHPAHHYDARRDQLAVLATMVYEGVGNPACRIFVSHGSFMEFDYRRSGVDTVSIARSGSVEAAADEIRSLFVNFAPIQSGYELHK